MQYTYVCDKCNAKKVVLLNPAGATSAVVFCDVCKHRMRQNLRKNFFNGYDK